MPQPRRNRPPGAPRTAALVLSWLLAADAEATAVGVPLLTAAGAAYLREVLVEAAPARARKGAAAERRSLPHWDAAERRLWFGTTLLHEFRQPAEKQTALLDAFQANGWVERHVSYPIAREPNETESEYQDRLHHAIKNLNRAMPAGTIHFRGDGTGRGVWWDYAPPTGAVGGEPPLQGDGSAETRH
jgi:hypothetical protein